MRIQRGREAAAPREFNCDLRRLVPSIDLADGTPWGAAIATVHPTDETTPHAHDEDEVFLVLRGRGKLVIDGESEVLESGDFVRIPRNKTHSMLNESETEDLQFLTIYWGEVPEYFAAKG